MTSMFTVETIAVLDADTSGKTLSLDYLQTFLTGPVVRVTEGDGTLADLCDLIELGYLSRYRQIAGDALWHTYDLTGSFGMGHSTCYLLRRVRMGDAKDLILINADMWPLLLKKYHRNLSL